MLLFNTTFINIKTRQLHCPQEDLMLLTLVKMNQADVYVYIHTGGWTFLGIYIFLVLYKSLLMVFVSLVVVHDESLVVVVVVEFHHVLLLVSAVLLLCDLSLSLQPVVN